jgi:hypothetical protein
VGVRESGDDRGLGADLDAALPRILGRTRQPFELAESVADFRLLDEEMGRRRSE